MKKMNDESEMNDAHKNILRLIVIMVFFCNLN